MKDYTESQQVNRLRLRKARYRLMIVWIEDTALPMSPQIEQVSKIRQEKKN